MKKGLLFILIIFTIYLANGQDTWFKTVPGWRALSSYKASDTLMVFGLGIKDNVTDYVLFHTLNNNQKVLKTDTLDYSHISNEPSSNFLFFDNLVDPISNTIGLTYHKKLSSEKYIRNCDIFTFPNFERLNYPLNVDTFETELGQYQEINGKYYGYIFWAVPFKEGEERVTDFGYQLLRFNKDTTVTVIKEVFNDYINGSGLFKKVRYQRVYGDNQDSSNLFLKHTYTIGGDTYKAYIDKLDSTGKVLWTCRPDASDSFNTTNLQMVQKPNGNLLCSWTNYYYSAGKKPGGHPTGQEFNHNMTPHFAEIDYASGEVLWVKTQRQFIEWKMLQGNYINPDSSLRATLQNIKWIDAQRVNENEVIWVGEKSIVFDNPFIVKIIPVIFKTDLEANPIWYRDYEINPRSGTKDDFLPKSFLILPQDSGILLTGEYKGASGQQAALFKLDKNGCRSAGCGETDGVEEIFSSNIRIYPNPFSNTIRIEKKDGEWKGARVSVIDNIGRTVYVETLNGPMRNLGLSHLNHGIYYIKIESRKETFIQKVIKN